MKTDYKQLIGKQVYLKTLGIHSFIKGVLVAVYGDVLVVQGLTCWGVRDTDILSLDVIDDQPGLFEKRAVVE